MLEDYKRASLETVDLYRQKPLKMGVYTTLTAIAGYLFVNNPSMTDYEGHLATMTCDLAEVGADIRNNNKCQQIETLLHHHSHGRLRRFTFGVCSVIWVSDYPKYVDLYEAHCPDVKMTWMEWPKYFVDVGLLGHWLWSEEYMVDFDINPEEWRHIEVDQSKSEQLNK